MIHPKVIDASRSLIHQFTNLKRKLYNCNASIYFNRQCLNKQLTPSYATIRIPNTSPAHRHTQRKVAKMRIKDEIKFLHCKKQKLNDEIYQLHLLLASHWSNLWPHIQHDIESNLHKECGRRYHTLDNKIKHLVKQQAHALPPKQNFHPRVMNMTDITFSETEMALLQKGPKYNIHDKPKDWIQNLALEAETAISHLPPPERETYRKLTAERINTLQDNNKTTHPTHGTHSEIKTIRSIKTKLKNNKAMITRADKGNTLVVLPESQYETKIDEFIQAGNFQTTKNDPTKSFQTQVKKVINNSKTLIPPDSKWKYSNLNPTAPSIKGLIKLHKPNHPIRPVVNWRGAPAYKLAQLFTQKIKLIAPLPNTYNLKSTTELLSKLESTPILPHHSLASLDIQNLYTNIPVKETRDIVARNLDNNQTDPQTKQELLYWYDTITSQNYFSNKGKISIQQEGLAMGAPTSGIIAEHFLQHLEEIHLTHLVNKHKITAYFRYVDDILLIYDPQHTNIQDIQNDFNMIHPNIKFTSETETNNKINYLDITIHRTPTNWVTSIYRKPTFSDTIIPYSSNHPAQHKYAAIRYLYHRLDTYHLKGSEYKKETDTIHNILTNNGFPTNTHKPPNKKHTITTLSKETSNTTRKWIPFTYIGKETTFITNIFKKTNLNISLRTNHTIQQLLMPKPQTPDKYTRSGAYKLTCPVCSKVYVGQTERSFAQRFKEHKYAFKTNSHMSNYAKHILEESHSFGPIQDTMQIIQYHAKGNHLNTIEKFHIYTEFKNDNHLNDEHTIAPNKIFDTLLKPQ